MLISLLVSAVHAPLKFPRRHNECGQAVKKLEKTVVIVSSEVTSHTQTVAPATPE